MHDYTWKGYFKFVFWVWVVWGALLLCGASYVYVADPTISSTPLTENDWVNIFRFSVLSLPSFAVGLLLPYGAFAPFAAAYTEAKQMTGSRWQGVLSMLGLLLVLIPVALLMAVIYGFWWALQQVNGLQLVIGALAVFGTVAFFWEAIKTRLHLNKLNIFKFSDSRKVIRR